MVMVTSLKPNLQIRLICFATIIIFATIPLSLYEPFAEKIMPRIATFSNLSEDSSGQSRQDLYAAVANYALTSFIGNGLGQGIDDSGILSMLFELGWLGVLPYLGSILLMTFQIFRNYRTQSDLFSSAIKAGIISCLVRLPLNSVVVGVGGIVFWATLGLGLASTRYHSAPRVYSKADN
jgi:cell division protein FtsW (lipid II flippase)